MTARTYANFDLLVETTGPGAYRALVGSSPAGNGASADVVLPIDATASSRPAAAPVAPPATAAVPTAGTAMTCQAMTCQGDATDRRTARGLLTAAVVAAYRSS